MEEKKFSKSNASFWSVFDFRRRYLSFLGKFNLSSSSPSLGTLDKKHQSSSGFTLIELLIVIIILTPALIRKVVAAG
jgi:prepilin-type N-terminal cleavage/methylation domain-containing protein